MEFRKGYRAALVAGCATALMAGATVTGIAREKSEINIVSSMRGGAEKQPVLGSVDPMRIGEKVVVKYFKKKGGEWKRLGTKKPVIGAGEIPAPFMFATEFPGASKGTCKLTARYPGNSKTAPSATKLVINCITGLPK